MGWLGKALAFVFALMLFGLGVWQVGLLIFAVLFVPSILRVRTRGGHREGDGRGRPRRKFLARYILGGLLPLVAVGAYQAHGTLSPLVLGSLGAVVLAWGRIPIPVPGGGYRPMEESVLLRASPFPVGWVGVAEVKPLTRDLGRAMAGVEGTVMVSASETPSVYVVVKRRALTERSAEAAILQALRETAVPLAALGAYLLPLDSKEAVELLRPSLEAASVGEGDWQSAVASGPYELIALKQERGFARSLGLYEKAGEGRDGSAEIPRPPLEFAHPPLLMEVFRAVGNRLSWPSPDQRTAFLSSLVATSHEPIGTRIIDAGPTQQSQTVLVKSQGSPSVQLSRAQLRAVVRLYDRVATS